MAEILCECGEWLDVQDRPLVVPGGDPRGNSTEQFAECVKCGKHFDQAAVDQCLSNRGFHRDKP